MAMTEMVVEGIGIDPQNNPLVLLRDESRSTFVPIWIGLSEAVSIQMELDQRPSQRPMTHDLISNVFKELGASLVKVTVNSFEESIYYASLHLQFGNDTDSIQELDARPSDAIALALRAGCRIFVSDSVAKKAGIQVEETGPDSLRPKMSRKPHNGEGTGAPTTEEMEKFSRLIEGVDLGGDPERN